MRLASICKVKFLCDTIQKSNSLCSRFPFVTFHQFPNYNRVKSRIFARHSMYEETNIHTGIGRLRLYRLHVRDTSFLHTTSASLVLATFLPLSEQVSFRIFRHASDSHILHVCIRACNVLWFAEPATLYAKLCMLFRLLSVRWLHRVAFSRNSGVENSLETWTYEKFPSTIVDVTNHRELK